MDEEPHAEYMLAVERFLRERGVPEEAIPDAVEQVTARAKALNEALANDDLVAVEQLLQAGTVDINRARVPRPGVCAADGGGSCPLLWAAADQGNTESTELLIRYGADVDAVDSGADNSGGPRGPAHPLDPLQIEKVA